MSEANFDLTRYRFEDIEANGIEFDATEPLDLEMKFEISFSDEAPGSDHFTVIIKIALSTREPEKSNPWLKVKASGCYTFNDGVEPYLIKDTLQKVYAANLLYGCMRPLLDSITNNIGLHGMNMPLTLPLGNETISQAPASTNKEETPDTPS
ncbi:hypothetical protein [Chromohalobacter nigrandesensis]|uniref:hypothetical protein n=1 Tax=Chromohalobacter nigrandesensis TaxID=119863 RepID=UPI001FF1C838|nr:hypothetical protein [Chromohalobacter nigrandesensis]MCK0743591.1 hypothetical protein [Chromohalobacter nigrandesensis]